MGFKGNGGFVGMLGDRVRGEVGYGVAVAVRYGVSFVVVEVLMVRVGDFCVVWWSNDGGYRVRGFCLASYVTVEVRSFVGLRVGVVVDSIVVF